MNEGRKKEKERLLDFEKFFETREGGRGRGKERVKRKER